MGFYATGGFDPPSIDDFLPEPFLFKGTWFELDRLDLIRFAVVALVVIFFCITVRRAHKRATDGVLLPTKPQSAVEMVLEFIKQLVYDNLGQNAGKRHYKMAATLFFSIFFLNITGIIPGLNLAASAGIGIPLAFALWVFFAYWREGVHSHGGGFKGLLAFVKSELFPLGLPPYVYAIYSVIELAQLLVIRPASLAIRLFANMMSGHILLGLCYATTQFFVFFAIPAMKPLGAVTLAFAAFMLLFEVLVAVLQAYIFTLLACAYISMSFDHSHNQVQAAH
ncbi:MAG: F0F1 ATP synthase subunit A [Candidatus Ancillula trichonymphae]|jgi:F-type H+-transporting ATPase subunit a|nr:F0F1 ATP synthase subunit A [Candidatus Ancillula trichonymphae]